MTFQRKMLYGFSLMVLPALLIGVEAIRTNVLERDALQMLGQNMARTRTYSELETAMFNQSEIIWRYLSGLDPHARDEFRATGEVIKFWQQRWRSELRPNEAALANSTEDIQRRIEIVADSVFRLYDSGQHEASYRLAQRDLRDGLLPALTQLNRDIYRQARESSVRGAYASLEEIVTGERDALIVILIVALVAGLLASWLISRGLARPISQLRVAMARVGAGEVELPIDVSSPDEIGDLARSFAQMTESLEQSRAGTTRLNSELQRKISQLEKTQAQLVQSEKLASIGEMAAAVAHGIRNPLASLRAAAQVALRHPESAASREHLTVIIGEVDRLDRRVSHLLSFSKPAPFHPLRESVVRLVEDLLPPFMELLREKHVTLELALEPFLPEVRVDPIQLEQAFVEIVSNALDAMPSGGTLRISATADLRGADTAVVVEIADSGVGIPERVLESVCEPFFTTRPEGTGLGLAIAKRYIEQNSGVLEIGSVAGSGTTVRIRLPGVDGADAMQAEASLPARAGARES
ncbi:MAG: HAMP domain-containing protein [Gemmatimonadaceae bacterium]|nr:HAMP domain-containing protein [Gemmatimonadaceae bacterium]